MGIPPRSNINFLGSLLEFNLAGINANTFISNLIVKIHLSFYEKPIKYNLISALVTAVYNHFK